MTKRETKRERDREKDKETQRQRQKDRDRQRQTEKLHVYSHTCSIIARLAIHRNHTHGNNRLTKVKCSMFSE